MTLSAGVTVPTCRPGGSWLAGAVAFGVAVPVAVAEPVAVGVAVPVAVPVALDVAAARPGVPVAEGWGVAELAALVAVAVGVVAATLSGRALRTRVPTNAAKTSNTRCRKGARRASSVSSRQRLCAWTRNVELLLGCVAPRR